MFTLIMGLNILQKLLGEFGVIRWLSKILRPLLKVFGLPAKTSFLWIVANILGLAYGAAVMLEEVQQGKVSRRDVDLLNHHIAISHSNLEDVSLFLSVGVGLWWMLLPRWILAAVAVWIRRWELNRKAI
jgi:spore maturation protein SpmB